MKIFKGIAGAPGIVSAKVLYFEKNKKENLDLTIEEVQQAALKRVRALREKAHSDLGAEKAKIFSAYEMLLEDPMLIDPIIAAVKSGEDKKSAIERETEAKAAILASKNNEYMRQRADDIRYIGKLMCDVLDGADDEFVFPEGDGKYIIAARELTPVDTMSFDKSRLAGFATELGGAASHTVILAKSLGIPAIVGVKNLEKTDISDAYLDGYTGILTVEPDETKKAEYEKKIAEEDLLNKKLSEIKNSKAKTKDGKKIAVAINIGKPADMKEAQGIDGVGLFRSEFLYSSSKKKPTLDEQIKAYREVIKKASPESVTIRTLDIGGDKKLDYIEVAPEENPFLGNRGIRLCLNNPEIFEEQLRAILIAAEGEKVKIMLPMVACLSEVKRTRDIIEKIKKELQAENTEFCRNISVGIMIETPAAAIMADVFAKYVDFFSIGTNDLVQYVMAADRGNAEIEELYNPYHPAVIRMIARVIEAGRNAGIEVSMCGDLAANTAFCELFIGLGLEKFSVPVPMASRIKYKISNISSEAAKDFAKEVLEAEDEEKIKELLLAR